MSPPGPRGPAALQTLRLALAPYEHLERWHRRHGPVIALRVLGFGPVLSIADREVLRHVFGDADAYLAGQANSYPMVPVVGPHSVFTVDGPAHMRQRRLLLPAFHGEVIQRMEELFAIATENELALWRTGETFQLHPRMRRLTSEAIVRAVFGVAEVSQRERLRALTIDYVATGAVTAAGGWVRHDLGRFSPWGRFVRARRRLEDALRAQIRARRGSDRGNDVLSLLLEACHEDGTPAGEEEILNELMSLVVAGHETSATALAWTFDLILHEPEVLRRAREEADTEAHEYLDAVVKEALRLRPPIAIATRMARCERQLEGWEIPDGTRCWIPLSAIHRDPQTFPEPHAFRPERFLGARPPSFSWVPFGGGARRCIGASFASLQMRVVLRMTLARAVLRPVRPTLERGRSHSVVVVPRRGVAVRLAGWRGSSEPVAGPTAA
jgi:cytochrome P450